MSTPKPAWLLSLVSFSLIGLTDATYLTYEKLAGIIPPCTAGFECESVLSSPWASLGPIPLSALGMGFYLTMLSLVIFQLTTTRSRLLGWPLVTLTMLLASSGLAVSIGLVGLMAFVIEAWCIYCLISAGTSTLIFISSLGLWSQRSKK